jgi:ABC-type transporter Mla subunit MlaD
MQLNEHALQQEQSTRLLSMLSQHQAQTSQVLSQLLKHHEATSTALSENSKQVANMQQILNEVLGELRKPQQSGGQLEALEALLKPLENRLGELSKSLQGLQSAVTQLS